MEHKPVRKAVFPAAGLGTRFLPASKAVPKEMIPLVDKPVIQYGVEEAVASGCDEIIIVTSRGKSAIEDHFDISYELEKALEAKGKTALLDVVRGIASMAKLSANTFLPTSPPRWPSTPPITGAFKSWSRSMPRWWSPKPAPKEWPALKKKTRHPKSCSPRTRKSAS